MRNKIFKSTFFTSMIVLIISFLMVLDVLYNYFENRIFSELESEAEYIAYGMKNGGNDFSDIPSGKNKRITLIDSYGKVIFDTDTDAAFLENHADREEFKEAEKNGNGKSERYSDTFLEKNLYYALRLENGNILRVSVTENSVVVILLGLLHPIIIVSIAALLISLFLSYKTSDSVIRPINAIDPDKPEECDTYEELGPLLKKLFDQKKTIERQINEAKQSREEFRLICENMSEGFLVTDKSAKVLSYNSAALKLLDIDASEGNSIFKLNRTKNFREAVKKALEGSRAESTLSFDKKTYSLIANPVYVSKKIIGAVVVIIDTTENTQRERLRNEFTSNVSHELKTPLTSISGFAEIMKAGGNDEKTVMDFSSSIYDEAQSLIALVNDIMKISEYTEGAVAYDKNKVNLRLLSEKVSERLRTVAEKNSVTLKVIGPDAYVNGSEKIIEEMVYNLLDNAIKYNKPNGTADIIITPSDECVKLSVRDNGLGIPKDDISRVFERFYRVDKSRSKAVGGTGLGLAIVKHGAMCHNAKIITESKEGEGTEVTVVFAK